MNKEEHPPADQLQQDPPADPAAQYPLPPQYSEVEPYQAAVQPIIVIANYPPQPASQHMVIHISPAPLPSDLGSTSKPIVCPYCHQHVSTRTRRTLSDRGWGWFCILLVLSVTSGVPLCCIPFCMPNCYDVSHYCSNCGTFVGSRELY